MKSKCAISSVVHAWGLGLLFLLCGLLSAAPVMAQSPVRIINPAGGGAGNPGLRLEIYADGSFHVYRDGKRETYEGSDKLSFQSTATTVRGPQAYISLGDAYNGVPSPSTGNLVLLQPSWVSPIYGSGTAGDPWKVQIMGKTSQNNFRSGPTDIYYTFILEYVKDNNYFYTNYLLYFGSGDLTDSDVEIYQTERIVMGADAADLTANANSECAIGYKSSESDGDGPNPSVVAAYRSTACSAGIPAPRSHVLKMTGGSNNGSQQRFRSYFMGSAPSRMNIPDGYILQNLSNTLQSAPAAGTYTSISVAKFFDTNMGDTKWEWADATADGYHHLSISTRMLTGYGTTPNDFDGTPVGNAPNMFGSEPPKIGFLKSTVKITEGNGGDQQYTGNMLYITQATSLAPILKGDLMLEVDGVSIPVANLDGNQAGTSADYKVSNGTLIKAFSGYSDTIKIPLDSFLITGNSILQYNRAVKLQLKSNYGLLRIDPGHDTCRVIIVDDEPRDISLTPLASSIQEGDNATVRASLPSGVTASSALTINLHLASLAHTSGFSIPATAVIPAGGNYVDFTLTTLTDNVIERDDTLHISADGQILGQNGASSTDAVFILKDKTHTVPANMQLTLTPATATVDKGLTGQTITASLPAGITTGIPINITFTPNAATTADPSSYDVPLNFRIDSGQATGTLTYKTRLDSIVYGPLVKHLLLDATAKDTAGNTYTLLNTIDLGINDKNWPLSHPVIIGRTAASIDEGNGTSTLWAGLPDGLVAGRDFAFAISTSSNLTSDKHTLDGMPTDSIHITPGHAVDSFAVVSTIDDGVVGNDETVTFSAAANNLPVANNGSNTLNIVDKTVAGPAPTLIITAVSSTLQEGQSTDLKITLDSSKTLNKALHVTFSLANGSTSAGDATLNNTTYTLPANTNSVTIPNAITANTDAIIEGNETFYVNATATGATVNITPDTLAITDKTRLTAAQTALIISAPAMPAAWTKGDTKTITVSLPAGVSTQVPISLNLVPNATSEVGASSLVLPAMPLKIDSGATSVTFSLHVNTDLEVYGPLTHHLRIDGTVTDGALPAGAFAMDSVRASITDSNWPLVHPLVISKDTIAEGSGTYAATITLPDGLKAGRDLDFNITATNSLTTGKHTLSVPAAVKISAGNTFASIGNFTVPADAVIGNDEDITFAGTYTGTGNVTDAAVNAGGVHIKDATNASALTITLTASASSLDEGQGSDVTVTLGSGMQLLQPLTITLTPQLAGTLTNSDFTLNTTMLTLPAGSNSKTFSNVLTAKTDNVLEANETLKLGAAVTSGPAVSIADLGFTIKDKTHSIPGATQLTVAPSAVNVQKGSNITLTVALASPYTTETPISSTFTWNNTSTTGSGAYTLGSNPVVINSGSSTTATLTAKTDNIVYGPSLQSLKLDAAATDAAGSLTINNVSVTVSDNNWPLAHPLVISKDTITEGSGTYAATITLPDGLVAGRDLDFSVATANGLTTGKHVLSVPATVKIANGSSAGTIANVTVPVDTYVGNDEDVTFSSAYTGTGSAGDAPVTGGGVRIKDGTSAIMSISLTASASSLDEGQSSDVTVTLGSGLQLLQPLTITLTPQLAGTLTSGDFTLNTTTLTLPAGSNSKTFSNVVTAKTDNVLEANETLKLGAAVTSGPVVSIADLGFTIKDKTHSIPGATQLTVTPSAVNVQKGSSITLTVALASPYTTETPISSTFTWNNTSTTGSGAYTLGSNPLVISSGSSTTATLTAKTDNIVYGPSLQSLKLDAAATDAAGSLTISNVSVTVSDNNWPLMHPLVISSGSITEGGTAYTNTITLPDGLVAGRDLDFNVSNTNGITTGAHVLAQPGAVKILNGSSSANIATITTPVDLYVGNDEDVTYSAAYTGTGTAANAPVSNGTLHITDATNATLNITLTPTTTSLSEDNNPTDVTLTVAGGKKWLQPINVTLAPVLSGTTTAADFTLLKNTLTLPANTSTLTVTGVLQANSDLVLEDTEPLKISGSVTGQPTATASDMNFSINDLTHTTAANVVLNVAPAASALTKGNTTTLTISLPAGVTTEVPVSINLNYDAASSAGNTAYALNLPNPLTLASGHSTTVTFQANTDNIVYGPATRSVKLLTDAHDAVKNFTINNVVVAITDNNWPLAHPLVLSKDTITEGGTAATLKLTLPDNLVAGRDLDFSLTNTNGITLGKHIISSPAAVKIPNGSGSAGIATLSTPVDAFIGNDEDVTFAAVYSGTLGSAADAPVTNGSLHIQDVTSASLNLSLAASKTTLDEDNSPVDVTVSINNGITLLQPLTINLAGVNSGTTTASDYTLLQSSLILPAGSTSKTFTGVLKANSDAVLEADEALKIKGSLPAYPTATVADLDLTIHDLTHTNAANTVLTVTPAAGTVQKGSGTTLNIALPTGITTEVPISINLGYDATSAVSGTGYALGSNPVTLTAGNTTSTTLNFLNDKVLFWPQTRQLKMTSSASDAVKAFTINNVTVNETDNNYPLQHPVLISNDTIGEGGTGTMTITLPDNLVAGYDMSFTASVVNSLTLGTHGVTAPAAPVVITSGTSSAIIANVSTTVDKYIGNDEDVTFSATGAFTVSDGNLHIQDQSGSTVNLHLYASNSLDEGDKSHIGVQIENNMILLQPLTIQFTAVDSTTHPGDYTLLRPTLTIPAGEDSHTFGDVLQANTDLILEGNEYMKLTGTVTSGQSITVPEVAFKIADITHNNPANTLITLTPAAPATWTKGDSRQLTVSLPAGVTTELPIVLNTVPTAASQLTAANYSLPVPITLGSGNDTVVTMQIPTDNYVYGPQTMHLQVSGSAVDPVFSGYTVSKADLDIIDNNYATLGNLALILDAATITEGGAATKLTLALPGSLKAGRDLAFAIKAVSDLTSNAHVIAWPSDSVHFAYGDHSITVALPQAATDKVIGNNENITVSAVATGFTVSGTTLHITDATATDPISGKVTLTVSATSVLEGHNVQLTASLGAGVTATHDIIVNLAANAASTASSTDYSLPASITIPTGSSAASVTLAATTDNILEPTESLRIDGTSTGLTVTSANVQIDDATHLDPANTALQITIDSSSIIKGHSTKVTVSFVNSTITTAQAFNIAISAAGASTAAASDYNTLPSALQMPAGAGSTSFTLQTLNNNLNETVVGLVLAANASGYAISNSNTLNIITVIQLTVKIVKTQDAAEPATDGAFTVQLPAGTVAAADITVTLNIDNTGATANFVAPPTQVTIPAGAGSVSVPVVIKDDYILQGDGELTATITAATSASGTILVDNTPAVMTITDDENAATGPKAEARKIVIEKINDARKPASNGAFRIRFADARVSVAKDVQVSYTASGDAEAGADYQALPGTVVIPAFQTEAVVEVAPILNDNVFKDVTATFTLGQVSSAMKSINWNISDTAAATDIVIRDNNGVPDTAMAIIGPNRWTDDTTRKIRVHPALSPNGDGVGNDAMYVENINKFPENEVTVFNRWGATVFHTRNYENVSNNFAGRYNVNGSGNVPEGTYYYIIIINDHGKQERYTGFVVIRR